MSTDELTTLRDAVLTIYMSHHVSQRKDMEKSVEAAWLCGQKEWDRRNTLRTNDRRLLPRS